MQFKRRTSDFQVLPSGLDGVTVVEANSVHVFGRHTHDVFGIGTIDRGGQISASGRGVVAAHEGDIITVNPNEVHDGIPRDGQGRAWRMLYLEPAIVAEAAAAISGDRRPQAELAFPVLKLPTARLAFDRLYAVARQPLPIAAPHGEERLLMLLAQVFDIGVGDVAPAIPGRLAALRRRIDEDPADDAPLEAMATETGLSQFELIRAFSRWFGLPPHAYRVQKRVQLARRLILARHSPAEAALTAGFADQSHMTRAFKNAYGLTPSAFRKPR